METIKLLKEHCIFGNPYDVYILISIARKKDNEGITNSQEIVFREIIKNPEEIERKYNKLKTLVKNYKDENNKSYSFYTYISVNPRDSRKAFFLLQNRFNTMLSESLSGVDVSIKFKRINGLWMSALANPNCRGSRKLFMVDLDVKNKKKLDFILRLLGKFTTIYQTIETKNGYHILVKPFNRTLIMPNNLFEIKTDALLFLEHNEVK